MNHTVRTQRKRAFSLPELLIVIFIIGLLFVLIVANLGWSTDKTRLTGVQNDFSAYRVACNTVATQYSGFSPLVVHDDTTNKPQDVSKLVDEMNKCLDASLQLKDEGSGAISTTKEDPWGEVYRIFYRYTPDSDFGEMVFICTGRDLDYKTEDDYVMVVTYQLTVDGFTIRVEEDCAAKEYCTHNWSDWSCVTEPTCTKPGLEKRTCSLCGAEQTRIVAARGHDVPNLTTKKSATCTESGLEVGTCTRCGVEVNQTTPALGHKPITNPALDATCTADGHTEGVICERCSAVLTPESKLPALGHTYEARGDLSRDATCTMGGMIYMKCIRCDAHKEENTPALGHDWSDWTVTDENSRTRTEERYCMRGCGATETRTIEVGPDTPIPGGCAHDWQYHDAVAATCTTPGNTAGKKCTKCGEVGDGYLELPALNHYIGSSNEKDYREAIPAREPTCTEPGNTAGKKCTLCGAVLDGGTVIPATGHNIDKEHDTPVEYVAPTAGMDGYAVYRCKNIHGGKQCEYTEKEYLSIHSHTYGDWITVNEATCTKEGEKYRECSECHDKDYAPIPALGHDPVPDNRVEPTCVKTGLTKGSHCSRCHEILEAQTTIPANGHTEDEPKVENYTAATAIAEGSYDNVYYCKVCEAFIRSEHCTIPASGQVDLSTCTVTLNPTSFTYDGTAKEPAVTVKHGTTVVSNTWYTVSYHNNINAGTNTASVVITATGASDNPYCNSKTVYFSIKKGNQDPKVQNVTVHVDKTEELKIDDIKGSNNTVTVTSGNDDMATIVTSDYTYAVTGVSAGTVSVTVKIVDRDGNYNDYLQTFTNVVTVEGHIAETDYGTPATCMSDGRTDGSHCSVCGAVLAKQEVIPALGHEFKDNVDPEQTYIGTGDGWYVVTPATYDQEGAMQRDCTRCDYSEPGTIAQLGKTNIGTSRFTVIVTPASYPYTGSAIVPTTITLKDTTTNTIVPKKWYTVSYPGGHTDVNEEVTVRLTAKKIAGNPYSGSIDGSFAITKASHTINVSDTTVHVGIPTEVKCTGTRGEVSLTFNKNGYANAKIEGGILTITVEAYVNDLTLTIADTGDKNHSSDTKTITVTVTDHVRGEVEREPDTDVAPTCTKDGYHYEIIKCKVCETVLNRTRVPDKAKGHDFNTTIVLNPDQKKYPGYISNKKVCKVCGCIEYEDRPILFSECTITLDPDGLIPLDSDRSCTYTGSSIKPNITITYVTGDGHTVVYWGGSTVNKTVVDETTYSNAKYLNVGYGSNISGQGSVTPKAKNPSPFKIGEQTTEYFNIDQLKWTINANDIANLVVYATKDIGAIITDGTESSGTPSVTPSVTYKVTKPAENDDSVVTVDDNGMVTGKGSGEVTIKITVAGDAGHKEATKDIKVTVIPGTMPDNPTAAPSDGTDPDSTNQVVVVVKNQSTIFDGSTHPADVHVYLNGKEVDASHYTVSYSNTKSGYTTLTSEKSGEEAYTNAGRVTVTVKAKPGDKVLSNKVLSDGTTSGTVGNAIGCGQYDIEKATPQIELRSSAEFSLEYSTSRSITIIKSPVKKTDKVPAPVLSCESDNENVAAAALSASGTECIVTGKQADQSAKITITVSYPETRNYKTASASVKVTVTTKSLDGNNDHVLDDDKYTFSANGGNAVTYDGTEKKPTLTITDKNGSYTLELDKDFCIDSWSNNILPGEATVTIIGCGNYSGTVTASFTINKIALNADNVKVFVEPCTYTGLQQTPRVYVVVLPEDDTATSAKLIMVPGSYYANEIKACEHAHDALLSETGKDYEVTAETTGEVHNNTQYVVTYTNNTDASNQATATLKPTTDSRTTTASRIFTGTANVKFSIGKAKPELTLPTTVQIYPGIYYWLGGIHGVEIGIKNGSTLVIGTESGHAVNYGADTAGTTWFDFGEPSFTYTGGAEYVTAEYKNHDICIHGVKSTSSDNKEVTLKVAFPGSSNFELVEKSIKIIISKAPSQQSDTDDDAPYGWYAEITATPDYEDGLTPGFFYDGSKKKPTVVVYLNDRTEVPITNNYSIVYSNNTEVGEATITITADSSSKLIKGTYVLHFDVIGPARLTTGSEFNQALKDFQPTMSRIMNIKFDCWNESYRSMFGAYESDYDVSAEGNGSIRLFFQNTTIYVLANKQAGIWARLNSNHYGFVANENAAKAFYGLDAVRKINVSDIDFSGTTDMSHFLDGCSLLSQLTFGNVDRPINTSNVTDFSYFLKGCSTLQNIDLRELNVSKATTLAGFFESASLYSVNISGWNTANVTDMSAMFAQNRFARLDISGLDMRKVKTMERMFQGNTYLTELNMRNTTSALENCAQAFEGCTALKELDIGSFGSTSLWNVRSMFTGCSALQTIWADRDPLYSSAITTGVIVQARDRGEDLYNLFASTPNLTGGMGTTYSKIMDAGDVWIATSIFYFRIDGSNDRQGYLTNNQVLLMPGAQFNAAIVDLLADRGTTPVFLHSIIYEPWETFHATHDNDAFAWDTGVNVDANNVGLIKAFYDGSGVVYICPHPHLREIFVNPNAGSMYSGFNLTALPTTIGVHVSWKLVENMTSCFANTGLKQIALAPNAANYCDTVNCTTFTSAFQGCNQLTEFDFSVFDFSNATKMNYFLDGCTALKTVKNAESAATSRVTNFDFMFNCCSALTEVRFNLHTESATSMMAMFQKCSGMITFGPVTWNTSKVTNFSQMFAECSSLKTVYLSDFTNNALTNINKWFYKDSSLERIFVDQNWDNTRRAISPIGGIGYYGENVFTDCTALVGGNGASFDLTDSFVTKFNSSYTNSYRAIANNYTRSTDPNNFNRGYFTLLGVDTITLDTTATIKPGTDIQTQLDKVARSKGKTKDNIIHIVVGSYDTLVVPHTTPPSSKSPLEQAFDGGYDVSVEQNRSVIMFAYVPTSKGTLPGTNITAKSGELTIYIVFNTHNPSVLLSDDHMNFPSVCTDMFSNLPNLLDVTIDSTVARGDKVTNTTRMFSNDPKVRSIDLEWMAQATGLQFAEAMFKGDAAMTKIDLGEFVGAGMTNAKEMFSGCTALQYIYMTSVQLNAQIATNKMFYNDSNLIHIYVGQNVGSVYGRPGSTENMFYGCNRLMGSQGTKYSEIKVTDGTCGLIDGADTNGNYPPVAGNPAVQGYFFYVNGDAARVLSAGLIFNNIAVTAAQKTTITTVIFETRASFEATCGSGAWNNLVHANVDLYQTGSIRAFTVGNVLHVVINDGFTGIVANPDCSHLLEGFKALTTIDWGVLNTNGIGDGTLSGSITLQNAPKVLSDQYKETDYGDVWMVPTYSFAKAFNGDLCLTTAGCGTLTSDVFSMASLYLGNASSFTDAFAMCQSLKTVQLVSGLSDVNANNTLMLPGTYQGMFNGCIHLTSVDSNHISFVGVINAASMFMNCSDLQSITLRTHQSSAGDDFAESATIASMFEGCSGLQTVVVDLNTKHITAMNAMFKNCVALQTVSNVSPAAQGIDLRWMNTLCVVTENEMFYGCTSITAVTFGDQFTNAVLQTCDSMFEGCNQLATLTGFDKVINSSKPLIIEKVSALESCKKMFKGCSQLSSISLINFSTKDNKIDAFEMFQNCKSSLVIQWNTSGSTKFGAPLHKPDGVKKYMICHVEGNDTRPAFSYTGSAIVLD